ncbi:hypothetical protein EYZ11_012415 [Aspergillus tanneri]|uniref:Uncharacterized protein n=1 Tax=Aspergillus tanneri TaxID=1220188 RepID=A0A4S3J0B1_9EURO|nr:hypothetical protein EYZ11_012415 [Aspergillus tanneri]
MTKHFEMHPVSPAKAENDLYEKAALFLIQ